MMLSDVRNKLKRCGNEFYSLRLWSYPCFILRNLSSWGLILLRVFFAMVLLELVKHFLRELLQTELMLASFVLLEVSLFKNMLGKEREWFETVSDGTFKESMHCFL